MWNKRGGRMTDVPCGTNGGKMIINLDEATLQRFIAYCVKFGGGMRDIANNQMLRLFMTEKNKLSGQRKSTKFRPEYMPPIIENRVIRLSDEEHVRKAKERFNDLFHDGRILGTAFCSASGFTPFIAYCIGIALVDWLRIKGIEMPRIAIGGVPGNGGGELFSALTSAFIVRGAVTTVAKNTFLPGLTYMMRCGEEKCAAGVMITRFMGNRAVLLSTNNGALKKAELLDVIDMASEFYLFKTFNVEEEGDINFLARAQEDASDFSLPPDKRKLLVKSCFDGYLEKIEALLELEKAGELPKISAVFSLDNEAPRTVLDTIFKRMPVDDSYCNAEELKERVLRSGAEVGLMLLKDGALLRVIDENGEEVNGETMAAFMVEAMQERGRPVTAFISTSITGKLHRYINERGTIVSVREGNSILSRAKSPSYKEVKTGLSFLEDGGIALKRNAYIEDGIFLALLILKNMALRKRAGKPYLFSGAERFGGAELKSELPFDKSMFDFSVRRFIRDVKAWAEESSESLILNSDEKNLIIAITDEDNFKISLHPPSNMAELTIKAHDMAKGKAIEAEIIKIYKKEINGGLDERKSKIKV
ncbi:MAG: hypothetical protein RR352_07625, partial [Clostridia bacterium]